MFKRNWKRLSIAAGLAFSLLAAGCSSDDSATDGGKDGAASIGSGQKIELAYVEWDTEIASTNVIGKVLEDLGYKVKLTPLDNAVMWEAVSKGEADAMVAAWLPGTHAAQFEEYGDKLVDLGANLEGAAIGLVVPSYMDVKSIEDLTDQAKKVITGIEPGAGVVAAAEQTLEDYPNMKGWEVQTSSSGAMATALGQAFKNKEEIIITGWSPHWMFQKYDLKYLEDPKGTFGAAEEIHTMVRQDLKDDIPEAYKVLDNFFWTPEEMEEVMLAIQEGKTPKDAASAWIKANPDRVEEWTKGIK